VSSPNSLQSILYTRYLTMSVKVKDVLNVFKQNRVDRALGLLEPQSRYGLVSSQSSSSTNPAANWSINSSEKSKCSVNNSEATSTWNHSNIARAEQGTTFYFKQNISQS